MHSKFAFEALENRVLMTVFMVTDTNPSGAGSLFAAITAANLSSAAGNSIQFNIPGAGGHTIVAAPLPAITEPVLIDGLTQPGAAGKPAIEIVGGAVASDGLDINAVGVTVRGLAIGNFAFHGIAISASGATITDCYLGVDLSGNVALPNGFDGLYDSETTGGDVISNNVISGNNSFGMEIDNSPNVTLTGNFVGTNAAGTAAIPNGTGHAGITLKNSPSAIIQGNVVSGSLGRGIELFAGSSGAILADNKIGTDVTGTYAIPNMEEGIYTESANVQIGSAGAGNVISGNGFSGILIAGSAATGTNVQANFIGTNAAGTAAVPNNMGIWLTTALTGGPTGTPTGVLIGGSAAGDGNTISGNTANDGIVVSGNGNTVQNNRVGTNAAGTAALPNFIGIYIEGGANNVITGNLASGNSGVGISVEGASAIGNVIQGNLVGTDVTGTQAIGNVGGGIFLGDTDPNYPGAPTNTLIGGSGAGDGNIVSGNTANDGILVEANGNTVQNNRVGTNTAGTAALPNYAGIGIEGGANHVIGNLVSGNSNVGIGIGGAPSDSNVVQGNFVGTDVTGTQAIGNATTGILLGGPLSTDPVGPTNTLIGGTTAAARNIVSGNLRSGLEITDGATGTLVEGNYIGTDLTGTKPLPNHFSGIKLGVGSGNQIGGSAVADRNIISGNDQDGIAAGGSGNTTNVIEGNFIGTDVTGTVAMGNHLDGILVGDGTSFTPPIPGVAANITIGGSVAGDANVIASNLGNGIDISGVGDSGDIVTGNFVGTNLTGLLSLGNDLNGILIDSGAASNTVGPGNTVAFNYLNGILVDSTAGISNIVTANNLYSNGAGLKPGSVDISFNSGTPLNLDFAAQSSDVTSSGSILLAGLEPGSTGGTQAVLEQLNSDGSIDSTFGAAGIVTDAATSDEEFYGVITESDGVIVAAGASNGAVLLAGYNSDGSIDTSFGNAGRVIVPIAGTANATAFGVASDASGNIIIVGSAGGQFLVDRFSSSGMQDTTFNGGAPLLFGSASDADVLGKVAMQGDGEIVAAGASSGGVVVVRLTSAGTLDSTFGAGGIVTLNQLAAPNLLSGQPDYSEGLTIDSEDRILVANTSSSGDFATARLTSRGAVDSTFGSGGVVTTSLGGTADADFVAVQPDGSQILVAGTNITNGQVQEIIAAYTAAGVLDTTFGNNGSEVIGTDPLATPSSLSLIRPRAEGIGAIISQVFGSYSNGTVVVGRSQHGGTTDDGTVQRFFAPAPTSTPLPVGTLAASVSVKVPSAVIGGAKTAGVVSITISNPGSQTISGGVIVSLDASLGQSLGGGIQLLKFTPKLRLKPGAHVIVRGRISSFPSLPIGSYFLIAAVSAPDGSTTGVSGPVVMISPPNVSVTVLTVVPQTAGVEPGKTASLELTLNNAGNVLASGKASVAITAAVDATGAAGQIIATVPLSVRLKPGSTGHYKLRFKVPGSLASGPYYLGVSVNVAALGDRIADDGQAVSTATLLLT